MSLFDSRLLEAIYHHSGKWPPELTSGIMFWRGLRITLDEFIACRDLLNNS